LGENLLSKEKKWRKRSAGKKVARKLTLTPRWKKKKKTQPQVVLKKDKNKKGENKNQKCQQREKGGTNLKKRFRRGAGKKKNS